MRRPQRHPEHVRLLYGPYQPPALKKGDRATCLHRDSTVVITGWSDAPIPWPRGRALGRQGGPGLVVDEELARAVRREAGVAVAYWFGVGHNTVTTWRRALGVPPRNEGSARLRALVNGEIVRGGRWPPERVERQSRAARE